MTFSHQRAFTEPAEVKHLWLWLWLWIMVLTNCASCLWMWSQWECFFKQQLSTITLEEDLFLSFWDADKWCPLPLKYFILPQVKVSITWQKGKLFVWFLASGRFSNQVGSSDVEIYTLHIQNSMSKREREAQKQPRSYHESATPTLSRKDAAHFLLPFEKANQNPLKACLSALLMPV